VDTFVPTVIAVLSNVLVLVKLKQNLDELRNSVPCSFQVNREAVQFCNPPSPQSSNHLSVTLQRVNSCSSVFNQIVTQRKREMFKAALTLFAVSFEFCLFKIAFAVYIFTTVGNQREKFELDDYSKLENLNDFQKISSLLNILNPSVNFLLYFARMSSFRKEVLDLFMCCFKCKKCNLMNENWKSSFVEKKTLKLLIKSVQFFLKYVQLNTNNFLSLLKNFEFCSLTFEIIVKSDL
jgi:hypothetical protein